MATRMPTDRQLRSTNLTWTHTATVEGLHTHENISSAFRVDLHSRRQNHFGKFFSLQESYFRENYGINGPSNDVVLPLQTEERSIVV